MRIKSLSFKGFKTFYEKSNISFDDNISAIVGPNGCGKTNLLDASIAVSRSEIKRKEWEPYRNDFKSINPIGSVAYKLALVSSGNYDIFTTIAPKNEWDICAGDCLVSEAGGVFKTINDKKIIYNQKKTLVTDTIIATNSVLFEGVSDLLF